MIYPSDDHIADLVPAWLTGTLALDAQARVRAHLDRCAACRAELAEWQVIATAVQAYADARLVDGVLSPDGVRGASDSDGGTMDAINRRVDLAARSNKVPTRPRSTTMNGTLSATTTSMLLATPNGTAHPIRRREQPSGWMGRISQGLATAVVIALLVALVGGALLWQNSLPDGSEDPASAPGVALASPGATPTSDTAVSDLLIIWGLPAEEARALNDHVGAIDGDSLTIFRPNAQPITMDDVNEVVPTGVPGQALIIWNDASRAVVDLTTGEKLFDLPVVPVETDNESYVGAYLFSSGSGKNEDWTIFDLRNGESRPLSEIVELPADQPAIPVQSGSPGGPYSDTVLVHFVSLEHEVSPTSDIPRLLIGGSLDNAITLSGYPPATQATRQWPAVSPGGRHTAWIATNPENEIVVVDTSTGEERVRLDLGVLGPEPQIAGFLNDGDTLVVTTADRVLLLTWAEGEPVLSVVAEGLAGISNPLLYAPNGSLYFEQEGTLQQLTISSGDSSTVLSLDATAPTRFTTSNGPWIVANPGGDVALIDARTGEIASQLTDVPPNEAEFDAVSTSTSFDGSTVLQMIGGSHSGYLVSPRFPDGLVLTAPIDAEVIEASTAADGIPVTYHLSPDGTSIVAGTVGEDGYGYAPQFIASVEPQPEWTPIDPAVTTLYWIPMPGQPEQPQTLPAQDFGTPVATPQVSSRVSCNSPGYRPIVSGEVDPSDLALIGGGAPILHNGESTIMAANGTEITFDEDQRWGVNHDGRVALSGDEGQQPDTITSLATGESWTFPTSGRDDSQTPISFVTQGPWLIGPVDDTATDWRVINTDTGESRLTSDIFDGQFSDTTNALLPGPWSTRTDTSAIIVFGGSERPAPILILPSGEINDAYALDSEHGMAGGTGAITSDGSRLAYHALSDSGSTVVRVLDGFTGELIAEYPAPQTRDTLQTVGMTGGDSKLILRDNQHVWTIDLNTGELVAVFDPTGTIATFEYDSTTGTAIATSNDGQTSHRVWLNPATGEIRPLDSDNPVRYPFPQTGWAVIETRNDSSVDYALLDMATGELVSNTVSRDRDEVVTESSIFGGEHGVVVIQGEPGVLLILDGPDGTAFEMPVPGEHLQSWSAVTVSISPNAECVAYTRGGSADESGTSWIAPLEPDTDWTELPFQLSGWVKVPADTAEPDIVPAQDFGTPAAFVPDLQTSDDVSILFNLRAEPSTASTVAAVLPSGTPLMDLGEDAPTTDPNDGDRWLSVATEDGRTGLIREIDLEPYVASASASPVATPESPTS